RAHVAGAPCPRSPGNGIALRVPGLRVRADARGVLAAAGDRGPLGPHLPELPLAHGGDSGRFRGRVRARTRWHVPDRMADPTARAFLRHEGPSALGGARGLRPRGPGTGSGAHAPDLADG